MRFLRRYTDLPSLIYLLKEKKITLLDPYSWDDSNDSHYLAVYKRRKALKTVLALCFTQVAETYHHWRVFAAGSSGVCIKFKRDDLLKAVGKPVGVRASKVEYLKLRAARSKRPTTDQLPFVKRYAFVDEGEFRVIFESSKSGLLKKDIPIPLSSIARITLSPWLAKVYLSQLKRSSKGSVAARIWKLLDRRWWVIMSGRELADTLVGIVDRITWQCIGKPGSSRLIRFWEISHWKPR